MKRSLFLALIIGLVCASFAVAQTTSTLIDFNLLKADADVATGAGSETRKENAHTLVDYREQAGASIDAEALKAMKTSLALSNWEVTLASSSRSVVNQSLSKTLEATVLQSAPKYKGEAVIGVRVHFPTEPIHSWAVVRPPFEIPAYADLDTFSGDTRSVAQDEQGRGRKFINGYGVVKNVGTIRYITAEVLGYNFPYSMSVILADENHRETEYFMGNLRFDGWSPLKWENPNYVTDARNRQIRVLPLYPRAEPYVKLTGIRFYKDAAFEGGDFITYVRRIEITYDKARLETEDAIDDEGLWKILTDREATRRAAEMQRLGYQQVLRYLETQKMKAQSGAATTAAPAAPATR